MTREQTFSELTGGATQFVIFVVVVDGCGAVTAFVVLVVADVEDFRFIGDIPRLRIDRLVGRILISSIFGTAADVVVVDVVVAAGNDVTMTVAAVDEDVSVADVAVIFAVMADIDLVISLLVSFLTVCS